MKYAEYDENILKHLQSLELMILKDFIDFCEENKLNYYIYGGSLLGAIRHQGFIPWDDDIDIIMFRDDYEEFKRIFLSNKNDKYELLSHECHDDYFFLFSKLMLKTTKFEEWWVDQVTFNVGINIDIFVLDYVSDNDIRCFIETKFCRLLDRLLTISVLKLKGYPKHIQLMSNVIRVFLNLLGFDSKKIINCCLKLLNKYHDTNRVCDMSALHHPQIYNVNDFGNGKRIPFEDTLVNAPENPQSILEQIYGDYMKLPPKNERYNHITENLDFGEYK